ncbi:MAG: SpoIIE family protein phosphatase [Myxococcales bacterium]|nr:SpoIIE family protein phosphatase [Myxococcales bacterium]
MQGEQIHKLGQYDLGPMLGEGGMSVVYRARRADKEFAIKVMREDGGSENGEAHLQFRREAAAIARLDHPSLIRVVEVGEDTGRPFLVMELAEGESLDRLLAGRPLRQDEVVQLARSIADALREVHRFGLVHRDIKPANIVLSPSGGAKLIDFGLVTGTTESRATVGTLHYAAPEQVGLTSREVGPPADLYALGATMFECLAGRAPLTEPGDGDFLHALATKVPPPLYEVRPDVGPGLSAVVAKLLSKDPDDRYQSARGLLADLDELPRIEAALKAGEPVPLGLHDARVGAEEDLPLVGRQEEVQSLKRSWRRVLSGAQVFLQIEGESGSGKTRLVREILGTVAGQGGLVLFGKCQELESVPFGPLREAAEQYVARAQALPRAQREEVVNTLRAAAGDQADLVRRLSPGLARMLGETERMRVLEPDAEQERYYEALAGFFRKLASPSVPLVLVVDDIQWMDEGSLRVLGRLAAGAAEHLLVLTTSRNGARYEGARKRYLETIGGALSERIELKPLRLKAVNELITARLGGRALEQRLVERLAGLTNGNPFAVGEYVRTLLEGGVVRFSDGRWRCDFDALDASNLPKDVVALVVNRLYGLGAGASTIVGLAAIVGGRFSRSLLDNLCPCSPAQLSRSLEELVRAGLVERESPDAYAFVHDRVREAAIERLDESVRRDLHQQVAEALEAHADGSATHLYALARHYAQGHTDRDPGRVATSNLEAGLRALDDHANEEAFELLDRALDMAERAGIRDKVAGRLLEGLGRACAMTGRHERAFEHIEEALRWAETREDRFRLQHLLTLTYASQGRNDEALAALYSAFDVLGRRFPKTTVGQALSLVGFWILGLVLRITGLGYGKATGGERMRRQVLSQLHYAGSMLALFQGKPLLMVLFVVRDFANVHRLGPTAEAAIAYSVYGAVLGMFQLRGTMQRYLRMGLTIAEQIGDRAAHAVCKAYEATGTKWAGDFAKGNQLLVEALPQLQRYVPGSWYTAMMICEQAYSYLHGGLSTEAIAHARAYDAALEQTNNQMFRYNTRSVLYAEMMVCGETSEAAALWETLEPRYAAMSDTIYVGLARVIATLEVMVDREDTGHEVDEAIESFGKLLSEDYYSNAARMLAGYARMSQFLAAREGERARYRALLMREIRGLGLRAMVPVFRVHVLVFKATLARVDGETRRARRLLEQASALAKRAGSNRAAYHIALEQARLERLLGGVATEFYARQALDVALSQRWQQRVRRVRAEFGLQEERQRSAHTVGYSTVQTVARSMDHTRRYADALLQVSLASASTLDPDVQAKKALSEVARVLGAERALFFVVEPGSSELVLKAFSGVDASETSISNTVVRRVMDSGAPVVLTGTDDGEAIGSQSIVTYGLRSIMAAPLRLRDRLMGVVYVDSRLAKGMFTADDVTLLLGLSNHIAIALETARAARVEAERSALQRDFELLGAVQSLLLPKEAQFSAPGVEGAGFYQPAAQCGGDWWWYEVQPDGSVLVAVGDVSGHGAGAAMISSAVAGAFHTMRAVRPDADPEAVLEALHQRIMSFGGGFQMTMALLRVDPAAGQVTWWSAAAPTLFIERSGGPEPVAALGSVLGGRGDFAVAKTVLPFAPGDALLLCTDGLLELRQADGRELGARRTAKLFSRLARNPAPQATSRLGEELNRIVNGRPQEDDITFVVVRATTNEV